MHTGRFQRFLPIAGMLFSILVAAAVVMTFNEPSNTDSAQKVFSYWSNHKTVQNVASVLVLHLAAVLLVFFGAGLRAALRSGEASEASYSSVVFGGAILAAAGLGVVSMLAGATVNAADQGSPSAVYAISQVSSMDWLVWTTGLTVMLLAAGLGGLRTLALPKALSWAAIALGVAFFTPAGAFGLLLLPLWTFAASVVLYRRQGEPVASPAFGSLA